eukprot:6967495-Pyramimonas_sp.AAC.1
MSSLKGENASRTQEVTGEGKLLGLRRTLELEGGAGAPATILRRDGRSGNTGPGSETKTPGTPRGVGGCALVL